MNSYITAISVLVIFFVIFISGCTTDSNDISPANISSDTGEPYCGNNRCDSDEDIDICPEDCIAPGLDGHLTGIPTAIYSVNEKINFEAGISTMYPQSISKDSVSILFKDSKGNQVKANVTYEGEETLNNTSGEKSLVFKVIADRVELIDGYLEILYLFSQNNYEYPPFKFDSWLKNFGGNFECITHFEGKEPAVNLFFFPNNYSEKDLPDFDKKVSEVAGLYHIGENDLQGCTLLVEADNQTIVETSLTGPEDADWVYRERGFTIDEITKVKLKLVGSSFGKCYFDDITIEQNDGKGRNLVRNGGFEDEFKYQKLYGLYITPEDKLGKTEYTPKDWLVSFEGDVWHNPYNIGLYLYGLAQMYPHSGNYYFILNKQENVELSEGKMPLAYQEINLEPGNYILKGFVKNDFQKVYGGILKLEPFKSNREMFGIYSVHHTQDFECKLNAETTSRVCDTLAIRRFAEDICGKEGQLNIIVIALADYTFGGVNALAQPGISIMLPFKSQMEFQYSSFLTDHEMGHSIYTLADEYLTNSGHANFYDNQPANTDIEGCPKWCAGNVNTGTQCYQYYKIWKDCIEECKSRNCDDNQIGACYYAAEREFRESDNTELTNCNIGYNCMTGTGCFFGAYDSVGLFRPVRFGIMNSDRERIEEYEYGKVEQKAINEELQRLRGS